MELLFAFFEDCNSVNNIGVNFGGKYTFKYKKCESELKIVKNNRYIESFFNVTKSNNITNLTGIVGENGSGKTTILNNIGRIIYDSEISKLSSEDKFQHELILSFIKDDKIIIFSHEKFIKTAKNVQYPDDIEVEVIIYGSENTENLIIENNHKQVVRESQILKDITCIYFSNIFDNTYPEILTSEYNGYYDISINGILANLGRNKINLTGIRAPRKINREENIRNNKYGINTFKSLKIKQIYQQICFIINHFNIKDEDIVLPKTLNISCAFIYGQPSLRFHDENINAKESYIENKIYRKLNDTSEVNIVRKTFLIAILDAYFEEMQRPVDDPKKFKIHEEKYSVGITKEDIFSLLSEYWRMWYAYFKNKRLKHFDVDEFKIVHQIYIDLIKIIDKIISDNTENIKIHDGQVKRQYSNGTVSIGNEKLGSLEISIKDNSKIVLKLLDILERVNIDQDIITFTWRNISSGEYAMLETYSRLYDVIKNNKKINKNILLLIDEGELYLHPEWQRVYIYKILRFLNIIFKEYKIQIVFASNTPLLITDIPRNNLVMLKKDIVDEENKSSLYCEDDETFASNITSLLKKSFFMKSTTGEFAKIKINNVLSFLTDKKYDGKLDKHSSLMIINSIGEPVIRKKLMQLYNEKYQEESISILLESEIDLLIKNGLNISDKDKLRQVEQNLSKVLDKVKTALEDK
ncbi:hypothetical protein [Paraclostridium tenue]|uniref:AAA family ATPase n=1 Tax=Paraclostridium tenue TaxID=1737 RepID=A0ABN1M646_9FIRM